MAHLSTDHLAPNFSLTSTTGAPVALSDYRNQRHVVLVFNRGIT